MPEGYYDEDEINIIKIEKIREDIPFELFNNDDCVYSCNKSYHENIRLINKFLESYKISQTPNILKLKIDNNEYGPRFNNDLIISEESNEQTIKIHLQSDKYFINLYKFKYNKYKQIIFNMINDSTNMRQIILPNSLKILTTSNLDLSSLL